MKKTADAYFLQFVARGVHAAGQQWGDCCHVKDIHEKVSDSLVRPAAARLVPSALSRRRTHFIGLEGVDTGAGHLDSTGPFLLVKDSSVI